MKKIIRKLANKFGYDFIKTKDWGLKNINKSISVKVGDYNILMPGNNQQIVNYKNIPDLNSQLAILAACIAKKYPDVTIIDIGANVGDTIAVVKTIIDLPIIAIEGDDTSFKYLELNAKQFRNINLIKAFLGESRKTMSVTVEKSGWNNTIIPNSNGEKEIIIETLDEVLVEKKLNTGNFKLLKIDTEGFDTIILRGCKKTILNNKPVLYFEYNGENMNAIGENGFDTLLQLRDYGYNDIYIFDGLQNLIMATTLGNENTLKQLHNYAHTNTAMITYFDICMFHSEDAILAGEFLKSEKIHK
jgi:FkbM family methyltransferase